MHLYNQVLEVILRQWSDFIENINKNPQKDLQIMRFDIWSIKQAS